MKQKNYVKPVVASGKTTLRMSILAGSSQTGNGPNIGFDPDKTVDEYDVRKRAADLLLD